MEILYGTIAYIIVTFPLAVLWHMKIFREKYIGWQYFGDDVKPILGLTSVIDRKSTRLNSSHRL